MSSGQRYINQGLLFDFPVFVFSCSDFSVGFVHVYESKARTVQLPTVWVLGPCHTRQLGGNNCNEHCLTIHKKNRWTLKCEWLFVLEIAWNWLLVNCLMLHGLKFLYLVCNQTTWSYGDRKTLHTTITVHLNQSCSTCCPTHWESGNLIAPSRHSYSFLVP